MVATRAFTDAVSSGSNSNNYSFAGRATGTAAGDRVTLVCVTVSYPAGTRTVTCTLGGNAMAARANIEQVGGTTRSHIYFFTLSNPTGITADLVVSTSSNVERCQVAVYALYGLGSETPHDTASSSADPASLNVDVPNDGVLVAQGFTSVNGDTASYTGISGDSSSSVENRTRHSGSAEVSTGATPRTVEIDYGTATDVNALCASWAPVAAGAFQAAWAKGSNVVLGGAVR